MHGSRHRTAVGWVGTRLARGHHGNVCQCVLTPSVHRGLASPVRSQSRHTTGEGPGVVHTRHVPLSGEPTSRIEPGSACGHGRNTCGPCAGSTHCGHVGVSHVAASCMHQGTRDRGDRTDRRDRGMCRPGRLWLLDMLCRTRTHADRVHSVPFRTRVPGWHVSMRFSNVSGRGFDQWRGVSRPTEARPSSHIPSRLQRVVTSGTNCSAVCMRPVETRAFGGRVPNGS
jgi:hypothetical protein